MRRGSDPSYLQLEKEKAGGSEHARRTSHDPESHHQGVPDIRTFLKLASLAPTIGLGAVAVAQVEEQTPADLLTVHEHEVLGSYLTHAQGRTLYVVAEENDESVGCAGA